jgi:hypothetical protein
MSPEEWRPIEELPWYEVSNLGNVRSVTTLRVLRPYLRRSNHYPTVALRGRARTRVYRCVHRLVALAFLPPDPQRPLVNHRDGNKLNAKLSNLEWADGTENMRHAARQGLLRPFCKPVNQIDLRTGEVIRTWPSAAAASKALGVGRSCISQIHKGVVNAHDGRANSKHRFSAGGFGWRLT